MLRLAGRHGANFTTCEKSQVERDSLKPNEMPATQGGMHQGVR
jgi:hypothetical protein